MSMPPLRLYFLPKMLPRPKDAMPAENGASLPDLNQTSHGGRARGSANHTALQHSAPVVDLRGQQLSHEAGHCSPRVAGRLVGAAQIKAVLGDELALLQRLGHHAAVAAQGQRLSAMITTQCKCSATIHTHAN